MKNAISCCMKFVIFSLLSCFSAAGFADTYPIRPVKVIIPWNDGFPANSTRLFAQELTTSLQQAFVVESKPGAGGEVAAKQVMGAKADGYTLLSTGSSITIRAAASDQNVDALRDLQPIAQIATTPYVIVAKAGRFKTFKSFIDQAKLSQNKFNYASAGIGTGMHYLGELVNYSIGIQLVHIPYSTGSKQLQAVLAGDVDIAIISLVTAWPQIHSGALEALAVSSAQRSAIAGNIPTLHELGLRDVPPIGAWIAIFGPKNLDSQIVKSLSDEITAIAKRAAVKSTIEGWAADVPDTSTSALVNVLRSETAFWKKLIKERNLPVAD